MNRPLNILHLTTFYPPYSFGGDAMYIYRLSHALGNAGHHVEVIHDIDAYHLLHPAPPPVSFASHPNVTVHGLASRFGWLSPVLTQQTGYPLLKEKEIREVMNSRDFDVIHYHNISLLGPQVLTLEPQNGQSIKLYTTHEHWLVCPMHVLWKFNERACEETDCLRCSIRGKRPPQLWRYTGMLEKASRHVDRFVSPSRFTAQMHAQRGFPQPVGHLPYFIDHEDHELWAPGPRPQDKPYFLFVGRLEKIKGLQTLIEVWNHGLEVDLLVAGTGTYEPTLRQQASQNPHITFLGALPQSRLASLYTHALACIVPSITLETFGIIIIEAFAHKTPAIVRDLGALPEIIHDSGGGYIFRTHEELLAAINALATSPALRSELGENGYAAYVRWWSRKAHLDLYYGLIREIANQKFGHVPWEQ